MESSQRSTRSSPLHFAGNLRLLKLEISLGHLYRLPRIEISRLIAGIGWAVLIKMLFTSFGLKLGLASNIRAITPAQTGVAIDVPDRRI